MAKIHCHECGRGIGYHELEAKTTTKRGGFSTRWRCPFCRADVNDVADQFA